MPANALNQDDPNSIDPASTGLVILAAGASSRMGAPKQLLQFRGRSLLRRAVEAGLASRCRPIVVVLGAHAGETRREVADLPVRLVQNEAWSRGLSTSVGAGLEALESENVRAVIFAPCDQPALDSALLNGLVAAHEASGRPIAVSGYGGTWGVPMLFARSLWAELRTLRGDQGAKRVAMAHPEDVACVPFPRGVRDIDTPEDYQALLNGGAAPEDA